MIGPLRVDHSSALATKPAVIRCAKTCGSGEVCGAYLAACREARAVGCRCCPCCLIGSGGGSVVVLQLVLVSHTETLSWPVCSVWCVCARTTGIVSGHCARVCVCVAISTQSSSSEAGSERRSERQAQFQERILPTDALIRQG